MHCYAALAKKSVQVLSGITFALPFISLPSKDKIKNKLKGDFSNENSSNLLSILVG